MQKTARNIHWDEEVTVPTRLYFSDLEANEGFKIRNADAIYIKVKLNRELVAGLFDDAWGMLEVATGTVFKPTKSPIERVVVNIHVKARKPKIYV